MNRLALLVVLFLLVVGGALVGAQVGSPADGAPSALYLSDDELAAARQAIKTDPAAAVAWEHFVAAADIALAKRPEPADPDADYSADGRVAGGCGSPPAGGTAPSTSRGCATGVLRTRPPSWRASAVIHATPMPRSGSSSRGSIGTAIRRRGSGTWSPSPSGR